MFYVLGASLLVGVGGTGLGGLMSAFLGRGKKIQGILLSCTAGIMLAVVCFDLIPETLAQLDLFTMILSVGLGGLAVYFAKTVLNRGEKGREHAKNGLLVAIAIALHNFPEGMIIGSGFATDRGLGLGLLIALHDIPEGMAVALPYFSKGGKKAKGVIIALLSGLPTVLGAFFGYAFANISTLACAICMGFAAGAMIYVIFSELIPSSYDLYHSEFSGIIIIIGILLGLIVIGLL